MTSNIDNNSPSENDDKTPYFLDSIGAFRFLNTCRMNGEDRLVRAEMTALKLDRQHFGGRASLLAAYSTKAQKTNMDLLLLQSLNKAAAFSSHCDISKRYEYSENLLNPALLLVDRQASLLDRDHPSVLTNNPTYFHARALPSTSSTIHPSIFERALLQSSASIKLKVQDRINIHPWCHSSLIRRTALQASSFGLQDKSPLLYHRGTYEVAKTSLPVARFERVQSQTTRRPSHQLFPGLLHRVLTELSLITEGASVASFLPDGKSFKIWNPLLFEKCILPTFFPRMKNIASFQRQLNLYDFKRIDRTHAGRGGYYHDLFKRDAPVLANTMKRRKLKGRGDTAL